jgi:VanZ family protein
LERLTRHIYPGLICAIIIMILCGLPGSYFPKVRTFWEWLGPDKIIHCVMFAVFSFSIIWGYRDEYCTRDKAYRNVLQLVTLLISASYGGLTELLQNYLFRGRYGSVYDFLADLIGCVLGIFIFKLAYRKKNCKKKSVIQ